MDNRATIYMNETDKANVERLMNALDATGIDIRGPRGDLSMSALFRHLVARELERLQPPNN